MHKYLCALGYCLLVSIAFTNAEIAVRAVIGGSFRLHIFPIPFDNPTNCTLGSSQNVVTIIPLNYQEGDNQTDIEKIEPLGNGQCGARVHNVLSRSDAGRWNLTISNGNETMVENFRITTFNWETPVNRTTPAVIGSAKLTLLCGPSINMLYCELRDPTGELAVLSHRTRCQTLIQRVTVRHFGVWTCTVGVIGGTSEVYATHTLEVQEIENEIALFANETSLGKWISWQVHGMSTTALWCRAFAPNGQTIMVLPGMENEKYVSVATNLAEHRCGLLMNNKFSEEYHGLWRLEIGVNARRAMGGFIRLPEGTIPGPKDIVIANNRTKLDEIPEINVQTGDNFRISCETQYSAGYCWIGGPLGQEFSHSENLTVGRCSVLINGSIALNHSGIWTCNMAHINGGPEEQFLTRVNVMDDSYHAVNPEIAVRLGMKTVIGCRSVLEFPLEYCRFVRPDGKGFGVVPGAYSSDRYSYEGPGLDYGYCGLAISSVELTDIGEWKCASRSRARMWDAEDWALSNLKIEPETNLGSFWSPWTICMLISTGFVLLVFIAGIITAIVRKSPTAGDTVIIKSGF